MKHLDPTQDSNAGDMVRDRGDPSQRSRTMRVKKAAWFDTVRRVRDSHGNSTAHCAPSGSVAEPLHSSTAVVESRKVMSAEEDQKLCSLILLATERIDAALIESKLEKWSASMCHMATHTPWSHVEDKNNDNRNDASVAHHGVRLGKNELDTFAPEISQLLSTTCRALKSDFMNAILQNQVEICPASGKGGGESMCAVCGQSRPSFFIQTNLQSYASCAWCRACVVAAIDAVNAVKAAALQPAPHKLHRLFRARIACRMLISFHLDTTPMT